MQRILARFICFLFCGFITIIWISPAWGTELHIPPLKGIPGESIDIPVMIDQVDNLAGVKLIMRYDPEILTFKKGMRTKYTSSLMHIINDKKPGILIVVMAGAKGIKGKGFFLGENPLGGHKGFFPRHHPADVPNPPRGGFFYTFSGSP